MLCEAVPKDGWVERCQVYAISRTEAGRKHVQGIGCDELTVIFETLHASVLLETRTTKKVSLILAGLVAFSMEG